MLSLSLLTPAHNTPAQKVKTQEFGDAGGGEREKMESLSLCWEVCCCWQHVYSFPNWCCMRWCLGISMLCSLVWRSEEPCNVWGRRGPTARNVKMIWKFQPICFHVLAGSGRVLARLIVPGMMITDSSLTPRIWIEHVRHRLSIRIARCKEVHCRVSPPLLSGDISSETLLTLAWPGRCVGDYGALRLGHL